MKEQNWKVEKIEDMYCVMHNSKAVGKWIVMAEWFTEESAIIDMVCWDK